MPRLLPFFLALVMVVAPADPVGAQAKEQSLRQTIADLDDSLFGAFNDRDLERFLTHFADDLEFYHDQTGLTGHAELVASSERLFSQESPLRRRLVDGS
ncbi:MAG: hypothetical protein R3324_11740, partial [Halobacteriales archaeon]|nr:hypothetical protein [Halobacteriales archaeon]